MKTLKVFVWFLSVLVLLVVGFSLIVKLDPLLCHSFHSERGSIGCGIVNKGFTPTYLVAKYLGAVWKGNGAGMMVYSGLKSGVIAGIGVGDTSDKGKTLRVIKMHRINSQSEELQSNTSMGVDIFMDFLSRNLRFGSDIFVVYTSFGDVNELIGISYYAKN